MHTRSDDYVDIKELLIKEKVLEVKDKVFETELKNVEDRELDIERRLAHIEEKTRQLSVQNRILKAVSVPKKAAKKNVIKVKRLSQTHKHSKIQPIVIQTSENKYEPLIHRIEEQAKDLVNAEKQIIQIKNKAALKKPKYVLVKPVKRTKTKKTVSRAEAERLLATIDAQAKKLVAAEKGYIKKSKVNHF